MRKIGFMFWLSCRDKWIGWSIVYVGMVLRRFWVCIGKFIVICLLCYILYGDVCCYRRDGYKVKDFLFFRLVFYIVKNLVRCGWFFFKI